MAANRKFDAFSTSYHCLVARAQTLTLCPSSIETIERLEAFTEEAVAVTNQVGRGPGRCGGPSVGAEEKITMRRIMFECECVNPNVYEGNIQLPETLGIKGGAVGVTFEAIEAITTS